MMVMITMRAARVKPASAVARLRGCAVSWCWFAGTPRDRVLPALVRSAIESIAGSLGVYVVDAGGGVLRCGGRISGYRIRIGRIGSVLHFFPIRPAGDRVLRDVAQVMLLLERLEALRVLLLVGVVVVDRLAHLEEVVAEG